MKTELTTAKDFERIATKQDDLELVARRAARDGDEVMPGIRRVGGLINGCWTWAACENGRQVATGCCQTLLEAVLELAAVKRDFRIGD